MPNHGEKKAQLHVGVWPTDSPCHLEAGFALHRTGQTAHRVRHPTFGKVLRRREGHEKRCRVCQHTSSFLGQLHHLLLQSVMRDIDL